jgi:hypothetical protein
MNTQPQKQNKPQGPKLFAVKLLKGYTMEDGKKPKGSIVNVPKDELERLIEKGVAVRADPLTPVN